MDISIKAVIALTLLCQVYTKPVRDEKCGEDAVRCNYGEGTYKFDACRYPADDETSEMFLTVENSCDYDKVFFREMRKITKGEINVIKKLIKEVTKSRCKRQLRRLDEQNLEDVIGINTMPHTGNVNKITNTYFEVAKQTYLIEHLQSKLASSVKQCCLTYPNQVFGRLKNRLLKKWFMLQNKCGDAIDKTHCDVTLNVDLNGPIGCERTADIIYLLLKSIKNTLEDSTSVLERQMQKIRKITNSSKGRRT